MKALIISSGEIKDINFLEDIAKKVDYIVCADGGANYILNSSIIPDLVVGDLDSIYSNTIDILKENNVKFLKFPTKKDNTDTDLCIDYLIDKGYDEIILTGVIGSRLDHTLCNVMLLYKLLKNNVKGIIVNANNIVYITNDELILEKKQEFFVSIIPITNVIITLEGFEYELNNKFIKVSSSLGISNKIIKDRGYVKLKKGICLVIVSKD